MQQGYSHYAKTDIQTADPRAVIVLLYEGAIKFLNRAIEEVHRDDRMAMSEYILKTQKIVQFLSASLDFEQGGDIAYNLIRLYDYMRDTLNEANLHASTEKIEEVIALLRTLLDAWKEVAHDPVAAEALARREALVRQKPAVIPIPMGPAPSAAEAARLAPGAGYPPAYPKSAAIPAGSPAENVAESPSDSDTASESAQPETPAPASPAPAGPKPPITPSAAARAAYGLRS
ncbi:MAG TPA: flagellar export chaperone FliS [Candidatus Sumerlaeota bacterium]|nr:flagellar export chaperone FliS [Candidatus Sumerlaeota bacterium]